MQTASTNICERLCNKSIQISLPLNILQLNVNGIITKWKQLGTAAAQPRSGRPHKMTEWGQCMLKHTVRRSRQLHSQLLKTPKLCVAFRLAQQCVESFMEWVSMVEQLHPSPTSPSAIQTVGCSGVKHAATGL
ncbi:unnamed protein product [Staurois parvus]|uniref:Uncharacterized protein n=1 Tax=Staurois parvus TaxID=386267 RepID=A0ABN9GPQ8_9NEOB|nr:unnamed protein product [Staurois parvus]